MTRKMLIISNPGEPGAENFCKGVLKDVENYISFFKSPLGGGWYSHEIKHLSRPYGSEVDFELDQLRYVDYSMVIFCGHGFTSASSGQTMIELRKGEEYNSAAFRKAFAKRTIILDCCRVIAKEIRMALYDSASMYIEKKSMDSLMARHYYNYILNNCSNGLVVMNACKVGETAGDDDHKGGYYSYSLLESAKEWFQRCHGLEKDCLSVVGVHNLATAKVQSLSGGNQNPTIEKPRSYPYFPFAVKV